MALRKQNFSVNEFYHLYNRGTDKRVIFLDKKDYTHFLFLMYICNTVKNIELRSLGKNFDRQETLVEIGSYCLMPNHFHILAREKTEGGISKYMRKLLTAYSMYFNSKHKRTGKLYEGVFKSTHANTDVYLKYLYSYIHLNPAKIIDKHWKENLSKNKKIILKYIMDYPYSSIGEYVTKNHTITDPKQFPVYFRNPNEHKVELIEWLYYKK